MLDFCAASGFSEILTNLSTITHHTPCLKEGYADLQVYPLHNVPTSSSENYINYTSIVFCNGKLNSFGIGFSLTWLALLFVTLATTADEFFCPSLEVIAKSMMCSQNVAGVTLLAFGNGAPEIFASLAGANKERSGLVISYLIGSGIFLTCVVAGSIIIVTPFKMVELPFLRDVIFYIIATFWTFWVLWEGIVNLYHALGFIAIYLIYLIVVLVAHQIQRKYSTNYGQLQPRPEPEPAASTSTAPDPEIGDHTASATASKTKSFQLTGDEITPWAVPPFIKNWSLSDSFDQKLAAANIQPITEESFERTDSVPSDVHCELCYEESKRVPTGREILNWYNRMLCALLRDLCPVDFLTWNKRSACGKCCQILKIPVNVVLKLTVPVVTRWCQPLNALHCVTSPMFFIFAIGYGTYKIYHVIPMWTLFLSFGLVLMVTVFLTSKWDVPPRYHMIYAVLGFVSSVIWVYIIANEIVALLITLGGVFHISDSILGLTVLAWGNSINDVVSDITIAREGYPEMGISACFGGPLFNLMMGLGVSFTSAVINSKAKMFKVIFERTTKILISFLFASLILSLVIVPCLKFDLKRWYGIFLYCLYAIFLVVVIVNEIGLL